MLIAILKLLPNSAIGEQFHFLLDSTQKYLRKIFEFINKISRKICHFLEGLSYPDL